MKVIKEKGKKNEQNNSKVEITTGYYETWIKLGRELMDYAKEINLFNSIQKGSKPTQKRDPSKSDYKFEWIKNTDSGKAHLINYKNIEM